MRLNAAPRRLILAAAFVLAGALAAPARAQLVPPAVNFQGRLTNATGAPISGSHNFIFKIFNASAGGTQLWTETQNGIVVTAGIYNAPLGGVTPLTPAVFASSGTWLEINVDADGPMSPRLQLVSVPFAFNAQTLGGGSAVVVTGGNVGIGTTAPGTLLDVNGSETIRGSETVASTLTVQGGGFSVGGSTLVVAGGLVSIGATGAPANSLTIGVSNNPSAANALRILSVNDPGGSSGFPMNIGFQGNNDQEIQFIRPPNGNNSYWLQDLASNNHFQIFSTPNNLAAFEAEPALTAAALYVKANGSVGVGTKSPASLLHISSGTLTIDGNAPNSIVTSGKIGLGTSTPGSFNAGTLLQISGASNPHLDMNSTDGSGYAIHQYMTGTLKGGVAVNSGDTYVDSAGGNHIHLRADTGSGTGTMFLETGNTSRVTVLPGGNVGIGTTNPGDKLEVAGGNVRLKATAGSSGSVTLFSVLTVIGTDTCTAICGANTLCLGAWTNAGVPSPCGTTVAGNRCLCAGFGD